MLTYFKVFQPLYQSFGDGTEAPISIGIAVTFMFHSFSFFSKVEVLIPLFAFFQFYLWSANMAKFSIRLGVFLLTITWSGRLAQIR